MVSAGVDVRSLGACHRDALALVPAGWTPPLHLVRHHPTLQTRRDVTSGDGSVAGDRFVIARPARERSGRVPGTRT